MAKQIAPKLNVDERRHLRNAEKVIDSNKGAILAVGEALAQIQEGELYRETHDSFTAYVQDRHKFGRSWAYEQITDVQVKRNLCEAGQEDRQEVSGVPDTLPCKVDPAELTSRHTRELGKLEPDEMVGAFNDAVEAAGGPPTPAQIRDAVRARLPPAPSTGIVQADPVPPADPAEPPTFWEKLWPTIDARLEAHPAEKTIVILRLRQLLRKLDPGKAVPFDDITFPAGMDTAEVREALAVWCDYKRARQETYKDPAKQLTKLLKDKRFDGQADLFVTAVDQAIGNNYVGCFGTKDRKDGKRTGASAGRGRVRGSADRGTTNVFEAYPPAPDGTP